MYSCGTDSVVRAVDLGSGVASQIGRHEAPVRKVKWTAVHGGLLLSGGWDAKLKVSVINALYLDDILLWVLTTQLS